MKIQINIEIITESVIKWFELKDDGDKHFINSKERVLLLDF